MKKITLVFLVALISCGFVSAQTTLFVTAPNGVATTAARAPNGQSASAYMRTCALVLQSELAQIPANTTLTQFGFTLQSGTSGIAVPGNFTVYLQNTSDVTYQKGTTWATAVTGMTSVFANVMTIPVSAATTSVVVTLSTPFTYTGGGLYVAYDWASTGPFSSVAAIYFAESSTLTVGAASGSASSSAPSSMTNTNFRPNFLFGFANSYTNEVHVIGVEAPGRIPAVLNSPHTISALVRNSSSVGLSNITVNLNVTGANPVVNSLVISSLAAGATTMVSFPGVNPQIPGAQAVVVSVPSDQYNGNNAAAFQQSVTCDTWGRNPAVNTFTWQQVGFGAPGGIISTQYVSPTNSNMTGIRVAISNHSLNPGQQVYGVLMNAAGTILGTTKTVTLTTATQNTFQFLEFLTPVGLAAFTTYYFGLAQTYGTNTNQYFPAAAMMAFYQPSGMYYTSALSGGLPNPIAVNFGFFGMEAVFQHSVTISASSQTINCGATATLMAVSNTNYNWSNGPTTPSNVVTPSVTTVYSVTATNTMGCMARATATLLVNPIALNIVSNPTAACVNALISFTASGAATNYTWASSTNTVYTDTFFDTPAANTNYTLIGQDAATGCKRTIVHTVSVNPLPIVNLSQSTPVICEGKSVTITASGNPFTYSWSHGPTTASAVLSPSISTIYTLTGKSAVGCVTEKTVNVTVNTFVPPIAGPDTVCLGKSAVLTTTAQASIKWSTNETFSSITVTPAITTMYSVSGIGSNGCSGSNSITIIVSPNPTVSASSVRTNVCRKEAVILTSTGAVTYSWSNGSTSHSTIVTPTIAIPVTYTVTGTNSVGCSQNATVVLNVSQCNGLADINTDSFGVFPNPAAHMITLKLAERGTFELYNSAGQQVLKQDMEATTTTLSIEHLPDGVYSAVYRSGAGTSAIKLVIRN